MASRTLTRIPRFVVAAALLVAAVLVIVEQRTIRDFEVALADRWFGTILNGPIVSIGDVIFFHWSHGSDVGMEVTSQCTAALLLAPMLAIGAVILAATKTPWARFGLALASALVFIIVVNQVRLAMIAISTQHWGLQGYDVSHKFVGSIFALVGFAAAFVLLLRISVGRMQSPGVDAPAQD